MPGVMQMKRRNGELAKNDKQNMKVCEDHFTKVYINYRERYVKAEKLIKQ